MIIRCDQCETQFQLDDSRVPDKGVRVRCSRCKHAFEVRRDGQPAAPEKAVAPAASAAPALAPESGPVAIQGDGGQWEFSDDAPLSPDPETTGSGAVGVLTDPGAICVEPSGAGAEPLADSASGIEPQPEEDVGLGAESLFGDIGDEIAALDSAPAVAREPEPEPEPETAADTVPDDPPPSAPDVPVAAAEELGSPETWAFVADPPSVSADEEPIRSELPIEEEEPVAMRPTPPPPMPGRFGALWAHATRGAAPLIGCLCALVMASIAVPQLVQRDRVEPRVAGAVQVGEFVAEHLAVRRIENQDGGWLLVVSGSLRNATARERALGRALRVRLHADAGPLENTAWAGEAVGERALRETSVLTLNRDAAARAGVLRARSIPAGSTVPFEAVFANPPPEARRAHLEIVTRKDS